MNRRMLLRSSAVLALLTSAGVVYAQGAATASADYVLGAGDVIKVTVYQSPELGAEARISESGIVSLPLVGQVKLGGLTISNAE
jgi:polysaccharide export outer membrane protein